MYGQVTGVREEHRPFIHGKSCNALVFHLHRAQYPVGGSQTVLNLLADQEKHAEHW